MKVPRPVNQPVRSFAPGTPERSTLRKSLALQSSQQIEIPLLIDGKEVQTGRTAKTVMPHRHRHVLATWHRAGTKEVTQAIQAALKAHKEWSSWKFEDRAAIFLRAAELIALDDALRDLARLDPRRSQIIELRFFGGLTLEETAEVMDMSPSTVQREWRAAKAWLHHTMTSHMKPNES